MKKFPKIAPPPDLDREGKRKFREMVEACDPDSDMELVGNYARQHSILVSIRRERAKQESAGIFSTMVLGRDNTQVLNPLIVGESRAIAALNRMLRLLGLTQTREERGPKRLLADAGEIDPLEAALCGLDPEPNAAQIESNRRRAVNEKLLARNDWRAYETDHDRGRQPRKD